MATKIGIIIGREFKERVHKKSFIITTLLMPVFMLAMMAAPALIMMMSSGETRNILVVDESGIIAQNLKSSEETTFTPVSVPLDSALADSDASGVLYIPGEVVSGNKSIRFYSNGAFRAGTVRHCHTPSNSDPARDVSLPQQPRSELPHALLNGREERPSQQNYLRK